MLLRLCNTADETTWPSPQNYEDYGSEMARLLFDHVVSHWKSKSADAVLADAQQTDFELRLHTFKTLGTSVPGYEREVLLACAHSSVEQLKILVAEHGQFSDPVEARLRRLAQAAVEGEQPAKRMAVDRKQGPPIGEACSQHRPSRSGCSSCNQITESRETLQRLRLAHSRAVVAERRAAQRLRCLGILGALSTPPEIDSRRCCVACSEDAGELLLFPCGHTAHGACLSQIHGRCPECHLAMEAEEAVLLSSLQPAGLPKLEPSPCRFSSKVAGIRFPKPRRFRFGSKCWALFNDWESLVSVTSACGIGLLYLRVIERNENCLSGGCSRCGAETHPDSRRASCPMHGLCPVACCHVAVGRSTDRGRHHTYGPAS